ncbi:MAG TPA: site-specific DNA-methyltransferase [Verrucomicrobiae bacterium]|jgi:site-specific DNA-methyltransferase (adenine-specific)|nr:site-specific DNA-methyltransferase [Verrucomicrobiae bacterium]
MTAIELIHGDCVEGMGRLRAGSVDLVVTSPPYNLDIKYGKYADRKTTGEYLNWAGAWARQIRRVLKANGSFFLNLGAAPSNPLLPHRLAVELAEIFVLQNTFHWIKSISVQTPDSQSLSVGHFKPLNSERYVTDCHEYLFHFTKTGDVKLRRLAVGVPYADKSNIARWGHTGGRDLRCRGNTWFVPYQTIRDRRTQRPHPATFPVALAEMCIKVHPMPRHGTMLDPFVGLGHAALAAQNCGVKKFLGFDIDAGYLARAREMLGRQGAVGAAMKSTKRLR